MGLLSRSLVFLILGFFYQVAVCSGQAAFHPRVGSSKADTMFPVEVTSASSSPTELSVESSLSGTIASIDESLTDATEMTLGRLTTASHIDAGDLDHTDLTMTQTNPSVSGLKESSLTVESNTTAVAHTMNTSHANAGEALVSESPNVVAGRTQLNACLLMERGTSLWYNYDKSAGAIDLALAYVNEQILSSIGFTLLTTYNDTGSTCSAKNHAVSFAMDLIEKGINCDVFIGGGKKDGQLIFRLTPSLHYALIGTVLQLEYRDLQRAPYSNFSISALLYPTLPNPTLP
jgi:hypothetical protein